MTPPDPTRTGQLPPRFKELMQGCGEMTRSHLTPLFLTMLENADVALLEFAGKAESNAAQGKFFEAMQELRRKRSAAEEMFFKHVEARFRHFIMGIGESDSSDAATGLPGKLSLIEKHEVEAALPVQNMIAKANANYSEQLYGLNQRLAVVNGGARLREAELPGGPVALAESARDAFNLLDMDGKTRMVIYAVFERYVMRELLNLYEEYNRRLVNAGVLPHLKYEIRKLHDPRKVKTDSRAGATGITGTAAAPATPVMTVGEETFQSILELMARSRRQTEGYEGGGAATEIVAEAIAATSRSTMLGTLDSIQQEHSVTESSARFQQEIIENINVDVALLEKLKLTLAEERQRIYGGVERRKVASADADIIDLVGMLFDYMLQDEQLPNVVKALLSRLHTPYLKVAILDRNLFTEKSHPARRLLDSMAEAGTRWVSEDELERGIFPCMRSVVERVLRDLKNDLTLFDELLADFSAHLREVEQRAQVIEKRTVEAADGQARLQKARNEATALIEQLLRGKRLAAEARGFLQQVWVEKLIFILLREREGTDSAAWALAVRLAEELVWSLNPQPDPAERDRLHDALPRLRTELRLGLAELQAYGRHDNERMFAHICTWQDEARARVDAPEPELPDLQPPTTANSPLDPSTSTDAQTEAAGAAQATIEEALPADVQRAAARLSTLDFDTWFEFFETDGRKRRLKLAWYSKISANYMFVDAMGVKAVECPHLELARRLSDGRARILELADKPFLERALETILGWLGRTKSEAE